VPWLSSCRLEGRIVAAFAERQKALGVPQPEIGRGVLPILLFLVKLPVEQERKPELHVITNWTSLFR
jgi:hypothetical protein